LIKNKIILLGLFMLITLAISISIALAEELSDDDVVLEADLLENMIDRKLKASGNAILIKADQTIKADLIEFDQISENLYARGNVILDNKSSHIEGAELEYSLSTQTGTIPNASFWTKLNNESSNLNNTLRGTASLIFIQGENKKSGENFKVTTCEADQDDWYIKASEAEINQKSQRLIAKDVQLEFFGMPVLYSPYANFSFNDQRKSGFLVPSIGSTSKSGLELATPYYFNLSPNSDATLTPRYFSKRGVQLAGEYRYLEKNYYGLANIEYMPNDDAKSDRNDRYFFKLGHSHSFGNGFSGTLRYEDVSDDNYFTDMSSLVSQTSTVSLPQEGKLEYNDDNFAAILMAQKFENLTSSSPYERLPSFQVTYDKTFEDIYGNNFLETNSRFEITEFNRNSDYVGSSPEGTRVTARPSIALPFETSYGYIKPKIIADIKHYDLKNNSENSKDIFIPTFSLDSAIYFDRQFTFDNIEFSQTLEPRIFYSYTDYEDQSMLPMFDTALVDLNKNSIFSENQFVGGDRVMDSHQITFGAESRIINNKGLEKLSITLAQRFYLEDRNVLDESQFNNSDYQSDSSDLFLGIGSSLTEALRLNTELQYNVDEDKTNRFSFNTKYKPNIGKLFDASYRFIRDPNSSNDIEQLNIAGQWPIAPGWSSVGRYQYDLNDHGTIESLAGLSYDAGCWTTSILYHSFALPNDDKMNNTVFFMLELGGLGAIESGGDGALEEALHRNVPGSYLSRDLPDSYRQKYLN
jgi:LPS-assembly protein